MDERFLNFTMSVTRAYKAIKQIKKHKSNSLGIKGVHIMCMYFLAANPDGLTVTELSELCCEDKAAISRTTENLVQLGYVTDRTTEPPKRKWRHKLYLTETGIELEHTIDRMISELINNLDYSFTAKEMETFYKVFVTLTERLVEYNDQLESEDPQHTF